MKTTQYSELSVSLCLNKGKRNSDNRKVEQIRDLIVFIVNTFHLKIILVHKNKKLD